MFSQSFWKYVLLRTLILSVGLVVTGSQAYCQIPVGLNPSTQRSFPQHFYGANGQERNSVPWCHTGNSPFATALLGLQYTLLRFPAGTGSNYWDWADGDYVDNYQLPSGVPSPPSPYPSPLSELQKELSSCGQTTLAQMVGVFPLNVLEDPLCQPPTGSQFCSYSPNSPNEPYQRQLLTTLEADNINVPHVELGNEIYGGGTGSPLVQVYPTATDYATSMKNNWIPDIKSNDPSVTISLPMAICDSLVMCDPRKQTWNQTVMGIVKGEDAVTLHNYTPGNTPGPTIDDNSAETMLNQPFIYWDQIVSTVIPQFVDSVGFTPDVWFTEYNFRDGSIQAAGTWAHGLYLATYSLLYATNSRVKMALHHEVQGGAEFADIFNTNNGFSNFSLVAPLVSTNPYGYSASGLTSREVDTAAVGQNQAEALTFSGGPTFRDGHPKLIGELYSGAANTQIIILNLDNVAHLVDLSALNISSGSYRQIHGAAGSYVDGFPAAGGFEAWIINNPSTRTEHDLTLITQSSVPTPLTLHAFSITRITVN